MYGLLPVSKTPSYEHGDVGYKLRETLRCEFYANCAPNPCFKRDQHF